MAEHEYAEDEFDRLAASRTVVGHREPETNRPWWMAALALLILVPLVGWAFVHFGGADSAKTVWPSDSASSSVSAQATPSKDASSEPAEADASESDAAAAKESQSAQQEASPSESASPTESPSPSDSASPSESASAQAQSAGKATEIRLLNGSRVNGLAASKQQALAGAGFTNIVATNYSGGATPQNSTVYYASEADAETAKEVGSQLGIANVMLSPQSVVGGKGIVVVLRADVAG